MDNETGELYRDDETGEVQANGILNKETGEMEMNYTRPSYKRPFKITSTSTKTTTTTTTARRATTRETIRTSSASSSNSSSSLITASMIFNDKATKITTTTTKLLEDINLPLKRVSVAPAFTILTLLFFVPVFGIFTGIIECFIHIWTHKKNKTLRNTDLYYRSPFHDVTCEFCSLCVDESTKNKITKLQDKRNYKLMKYGIEYVRSIVT